MTTQVNTLQWQKSLSLDRHGNGPVFHHAPNGTLPRLVHQPAESNLSKLIIDAPHKNSSFLYAVRLKQTLLESRRTFLNLSDDADKPQEPNGTKQEEKNTVSEMSCQEQRKVPQKKISFKIKKTSSVYRRNVSQAPKMTTLSANTVAQLTMKFNQMVAEKNSILEEPKFARLVKRVNSQKTTDDKPKVMRKPSVKMKPDLDVLRRAAVRRKGSVKKVQRSEKTTNNNNNEKLCVRAKISYPETPKSVQKADVISVTKSDDAAPSPKKLSTGSVKAAIEIFERRVSQTSPSTETKEVKEVKDVPKLVPKPKVPEKKLSLNKKDVRLKKKEETKVPEIQVDDQKTLEKTEDFEEKVQILTISPVLPQRRCDSMYETLNIKRTTSPAAQLKTSKSAETVRDLEVPAVPQEEIKPNSSFLWRRSSSQEKSCLVEQTNDWETLYDVVDPQPQIWKDDQERADDQPAIPPRPNSLAILKKKMPPLPYDEKLYEELNTHDYESCKYEDLEETEEDGYEYCNSENVYETLPSNNNAINDNAPPLLPRRQEEPLPPRPPSINSYSLRASEDVSDCYETIYNASQTKRDKDGDSESNYESIYSCQMKNDDWSVSSNRNSLVSSDQQSNSLYGRTWGDDVSMTYAAGKAISDVSSSDRSDEWIDMSDNEENEKSTSGIVIIRERQKNRKGWSQKLREQWNKSPKKSTVETVNSDPDHHYESLGVAQQESHDDDFDSFDSDTESECSFSRVNFNDSGVDIRNAQLPEPPNNNQAYVLTRLAASAGKHMKRLRRNWSLTKNDITKSISRMTKRKSRTDLDNIDAKHKEERNVSSVELAEDVLAQQPNEKSQTPSPNVNLSNESVEQLDPGGDKCKSNTAKKSFLNKFRRSMSISSENANELTSSLNAKTKSTFYLTETIDIDGSEKVEKVEVRSGRDSGLPSSPIQKASKIARPQSPPPPLPTANQNITADIKKNNKKEKRSTSWYAECGLFKGTENEPSKNRRPNTYWYAEVGLYQTSASTPSTSSAENSGNNITSISPDSSTVIQENSEEYYNLRNENDYYNDSIKSFSSGDTKFNQSFSNLSGDMQLRLQDEPLYQFYDAAVLDSVCQEGFEFDSDGYEEVGDKKSELSYSSRPSAMELISTKKNSIAVARTLWCEIPEVIQSSVLSTLNTHQRKLQEAKFEMITSEASYQNSLSVLTDHFILSICESDILTQAEKDILFGKIPDVKDCSEKLLSDLERCWQDNILLHGVCDIILKHAEENFCVYVTYCENQIILDQTLKKLKERNSFNELLRQLESSSACQSLTLYSFLMLPMQRITRWPLLVDAVLKRLSTQDDEYVTCQYALATINKIVNQCNEGARRVERETEMKQIARQMEFPKGVPPIQLVSGSRWLVRSGSLTQMLPRNDETKLTFGKRFTKVPLHLFLFNDLLLVTTKCKTEDNYVVVHYCSKSLVELSTSDILILVPVKDAQGRHLIFLTLLENHEQKTVELLLSCNSESDRQRWIEALSPPRSEDPDETLYECWDCPQVTAIHNYVASQPDELALCRGDIINVTRKMADGWYHGERIRDGETGWFPANYTVEVVNPHVRARNLKQRYRLLAFSENYLKSK